MSIRDQAALGQANRGFRAVFLQTLESTRAKWQPIIDALAMQVTSTHPIEQYNWFGSVPGMTEWIGDRAMGRLRADGFSLTNVNYSNGIVVHADDIADDRLGLSMPRIRQLAEKAILHRRNLLRDLINNGFTDNGYDGVSFFNAAHPNFGGTAQDNLATGAFSEANLRLAVTKMDDMLDENDDPLEMTPDTLFFEQSNRFAVEELLDRRKLDNGEDNIHYKKFKPLMIKGLTAGYWGVADLSQPVKPFIIQTRERDSFTAMTANVDEGMFMRKEQRYGAQWRGAAGYGFWQTMVASTGL